MGGCDGPRESGLMPRTLDAVLGRSFVAVAETGGTPRAAAVLPLTQSAVSQQIKRLEEGLGCELFRRDRKRMRLTEAGERLLAGARRMLAVNDGIWTTIAGPGVRREVRLGVPHDMTGPFLPQALRAFARELPGVRIVLQNSTSSLIRQALARDELDLGLVHEHGCDTGGEVLFADSLFWVGAVGGVAWRGGARHCPCCGAARPAPSGHPPSRRSPGRGGTGTSPASAARDRDDRGGPGGGRVPALERAGEPHPAAA